MFLFSYALQFNKYYLQKISAWSNVKDEVAYQPLNIVAVVGFGHMKGIEQNWNRHIDQASLLTVPGNI